MIIDKNLREILNELHFQCKMLRNETIDLNDFRCAVEEILEYYESK